MHQDFYSRPADHQPLFYVGVGFILAMMVSVNLFLLIPQIIAVIGGSGEMNLVDSDGDGIANQHDPRPFSGK